MMTNNQKSIQNQQEIRILVVDNDFTDRKDIAQKVEKMGFSPFIAGGLEQDLKTGQAKVKGGKELIEDAIRKAREYRCHAALVDMRLYDDNDSGDKSGLDLVAKLKPAKSIIVTGYGDVPTYQEAQSKGAVLMVGKQQSTEVLRRELRAILVNILRTDFVVIPDGWIQKNITPFLKSADGTEVHPEEIRELLALLFPGTRRLHLQHVPNHDPASLQRMTGTRRSSVVIKVRRDNLPISSVVKISAPARISAEKANFENFVKDRLQGRHYAQLDRTELLWNVGGAVYALLDDDEKKADIFQFRRFYAEQDASVIIESLHHFFDETWSVNIQDQKPLDESLFDCYDHFWARREIDEGVAVGRADGPLLSRFLMWMHKDSLIAYDGLQGRLPDPRRWIVENHSESALPATRRCVVHGDLNGENVFVDSSKKTWAIDFERTGYGHIFTDFVEMEHYILSQPAKIIDVSARYALIVAITTLRFLGDEIPEPIIDNKHPDYSIIKKAVEVIRGLRRNAYQLFPRASQLEYYWALLHDVLYGIQRLERLRESNVEVEQELEKDLLLGSVLCERIEKWDTDERWPLKMRGLGTSGSDSDPTGIGDTEQIQLPPRSALEKIIRPNNRFQDIESWTARCTELAARICRVEIPTSQGTILGTGFLVGPDLVMTNFHVIETLLQRGQPGSRPENVLLRFSYKRTADDNNLDVGVTYRLAGQDWLVDSSPYADEGRASSLDRLDYALLRLNGQPGEDWVNGGNRQRGWIEIPTEPYPFIKDSGLIIIQHPKGEPVKLAIDTESVIGVDSSGTLVNYRTNTDNGSSGSPCFSLDWELVALHHSGDPNWRPTFNAGTPISVIMKKLRERRLNHLIGKLK
ncbi:MAG: hypothetical protein DWI57_00395 [Chloroflexi bacterium]|nr:MAG: hypothetical protein DWI57_00395 [Chloroflexota bacterium]